MTLSATILLSCAGSVFADPILIETSRGISGRALIQASFSDPEPGGQFADFGDGISEPGAFISGDAVQVSLRDASASAGAFQNTIIAADGTRWSGAGSAETQASFGNDPDRPLTVEMDSNSMIFVALRLIEPARYALTAELNTSGGGRAEVLFLGPSVHVGAVADDGASAEVLRRGILMPGVYQFLAEATPSRVFENSIGSGTFNFDFTISPGPVPEPGSLALLGIGLIGATLRGWRKLRIV